MIYFDNAATTPLDPEVIDVMVLVMQEKYGNPSSTHTLGREARVMIENSRKSIAGYLGVSPSEIFFTSGGTEANNTAISGCISELGIKHVITTTIEHHAVLNTLQAYEKRGLIRISYLNIDNKGVIDLIHLESILKKEDKSLVSLMHANNEIGNLLPMKDVSDLCSKYNTIFHSDMVQTMGKYQNNLKSFKIQFASCSAHKFHGPKGVGFLYINNDIKINPLMYGGAQERNMRAGTENIYGIVGMAKAFEIAHRYIEQDQQYISGLKNYLVEKLKYNFEDITFNGESEKKGLYTILSVSFPKTKKTEMLLQKMDISGVAISGGSACASGAETISHVLSCINDDKETPIIRFSFCKFNTKKEIDICIEKMKKILY